LVDVTAVAHLFGGETRLLADAQGLFARRGLTARLAIAPTAGAAWALAHFGAHYGPEQAILAPDEDLTARLADLPVAALRLDDDVFTVLRRLGLKRLGQLSGIGRDALQRRFRNRRSPAANPLIRMDQLLGRMPEPLLPVAVPHTPLVQRRLLEPIRHRDLLDRVVSDLAADMARELEAKGQGARRLELGLWRVDGEVVVRSLELAAATRDAAHIRRLFSAKLDDVDAGFGIEMIRLRASWAEPLALNQGDIEAAAGDHGTSLAACIDRLTVRLGERAVRRPVPHASHIPERAQKWQPPLAPEPASQGELAFHARPLKLLDRPEPIAVLYATPDGFPKAFRWRGQVHEVARVEGPERIAPEWWREKGTARLRDYYRIEDGKGRRYWIYRRGLLGDGRGGLPDWFLQGLCG
jgi:protein ImuB